MNLVGCRPLLPVFPESFLLRKLCFYFYLFTFLITGYSAPLSIPPNDNLFFLLCFVLLYYIFHELYTYILGFSSSPFILYVPQVSYLWRASLLPLTLLGGSSANINGSVCIAENRYILISFFVLAKCFGFLTIILSPEGSSEMCRLEDTE